MILNFWKIIGTRHNLFSIFSNAVLSSNEMVLPRIIYTNKSYQSTKQNKSNQTKQKKTSISKCFHIREHMYSLSPTPSWLISHSARLLRSVSACLCLSNSPLSDEDICHTPSFSLISKHLNRDTHFL